MRRVARRRVGALRLFLLLYGLDFFAEFVFGATAVLFFQAKGFGPGGVGLILATYWWTEALFEVPTGMVADFYGRKPSVLISFLLRALGYLVVGMAPSASVGALGFFLVGVGSTFSSGAIEAWAVDEATHEGYEGGLDRLFSLGKVAENAGIVAGSLVGATLGTLTLALPFFVSSGVFLTAAVLAGILMVEHRPPVGGGSRDAARASIHDVLELARRSARLVRSDRVLAGLMVLGCAPRVFGSVAGLQWSVYVSRFLHGQLWLLGAVRSAGYFLQAGTVAASLSLLGTRWWNRSRLMMAAAGCAGLGLIIGGAIPTAIVAVAGYILYLAASGAIDPGTRAAINERIPSSERATVLSLFALVTGLFTGLGFLVIGHTLTDLGHVETSWTVGGLALAGAGVPLALLAGRRSTEDAGAAPQSPVVVREA